MFGSQPAESKSCADLETLGTKRVVVMNRLRSLFLLALLAGPAAAAAPPAPPEPRLPRGAPARLGYARMVARERNFRRGGGVVAVSPDSRPLFVYRQWFRLADGERVAPPVHVPEG